MPEREPATRHAPRRFPSIASIEPEPTPATDEPDLTNQNFLDDDLPPDSMSEPAAPVAASKSNAKHNMPSEDDLDIPAFIRRKVE